jgi:hypothetical protein
MQLYLFGMKYHCGVKNQFHTSKYPFLVCWIQVLRNNPGSIRSKSLFILIHAM